MHNSSFAYPVPDTLPWADVRSQACILYTASLPGGTLQRHRLHAERRGHGRSCDETPTEHENRCKMLFVWLRGSGSTRIGVIAPSPCCWQGSETDSQPHPDLSGHPCAGGVVGHVLYICAISRHVRQLVSIVVMYNLLLSRKYAWVSHMRSASIVFGTIALHCTANAAFSVASVRACPPVS